MSVLVSTPHGIYSKIACNLPSLQTAQLLADAVALTLGITLEETT